MKIALISDTHSYLHNTLLENIQGHDEIWHAGDIGNIELVNKLKKIAPVKAVYGNIDGTDIRALYPEILFWNVDYVSFLMTHIGSVPNRYNENTKALLLQYKPQVFICGHSHILRVIYDKEYKVMHLNPGACGLEGFHKVCTMLSFVVANEKLQDMKIIEWQR